MDLAHSIGFLTQKLPSCSPVLVKELLHASLTSGKLPGKARHCAHSRHTTESPRSNAHAGQQSRDWHTQSACWEAAEDSSSTWLGLPVLLAKA